MIVESGLGLQMLGERMGQLKLVSEQIIIIIIIIIIIVISFMLGIFTYNSEPN